jgi:hypothetical protein
MHMNSRSETRITDSASPARALWVSLIAAFLGGAFFGAAAKLADISTVTGLGDLGTYFGLWVLLATLIAVWSPSRHSAALRVGIFMFAMVVAYYLVTWRLFGGFPVRYFVTWAAVALLLSPLFAALAWPSRRQGWGPALSAALPMGLLLAEAFSFRWVLPRYLSQVLFDLAAAAMLFVVLPRSGTQRLRVLACIPVVLLVAVGSQRAIPRLLGILYRVGLRI